MKWDAVRSVAGLGLCGLLMLVGCGGGLEEAGPPPAAEPLGAHEAALCSGLSVSSLSVSGISTYQGEMAGSGRWAVAGGSNAVRLEYRVDGMLRSSDERRPDLDPAPDANPYDGTWYFSTTGVTCGVRTFEVKAWPMVIDSAGTRTVCWDSPRVIVRTVTENCAAAAVTASSYHTMALAKDGKVWGWGDNLFGAIGDGTTTSRSTPVQVAGISGVKQIAVGSYHTIALKTDGTVWTWGYNSNGQLGNGTTNNQYTPARVTALSNVIAIGAGSSFSLAVKSDGTVWAWGDNWCGPLGDGTETRRLLPVQVVGLSGVKAVAGGSDYSVALKTDGTVWAWGRNAMGSLGDGTASVRLTPVQVSALSGVTAIKATYWRTMALKSDGTLWAWGDNRNGALGDGTTTDRYTPVRVAALSGVRSFDGGFGHTVAVKTDGTVWSWGSNDYGQFGNGTTGSIDRLTPGQVPGLTGVLSTGAGQSNALVVKTDGTLLGWGYNTAGNLGDGTTTQRLTPVHTVNFGP
ncbi:MAG TPA: hypothetical protein VE057_24020 [Archangium sp.]|nr:hypothetical protein [Archangium sp.]